MTDFKLSFIPVIKKVAEDFTLHLHALCAKVYGSNRSTKSQKNLKTLYDEVRRMRYASRYAEELAASVRYAIRIFENPQAQNSRTIDRSPSD